MFFSIAKVLGLEVHVVNLIVNIRTKIIVAMKGLEHFPPIPQKHIHGKADQSRLYESSHHYYQLNI